MAIVEWNAREDAASQVARWCSLAAEPGVVRAVFSDSELGPGLPWRTVAPWVRSRAVTVAEIRADLEPPALEVALCADLVFLHPTATLVPATGEPGAPMLWALGRAGRPALARCLLDPSPLSADEAVALGLAQRVLGSGEGPPVADAGSLVALTIARDLMRCSSAAGPRLQLELAAFRLLFASGDPHEGARAFLERRRASFGSPES